MTTIHAHIVGDQVVLPRDALDQLVRLARQVEKIELETHTDDLPAVGLMMVAEAGKAFDWLKDEDDLYSLNDLKVRYR